MVVQLHKTISRGLLHNIKEHCTLAPLLGFDLKRDEVNPWSKMYTRQLEWRFHRHALYQKRMNSVAIILFTRNVNVRDTRIDNSFNQLFVLGPMAVDIWQTVLKLNLLGNYVFLSWQIRSNTSVQYYIIAVAELGVILWNRVNLTLLKHEKCIHNSSCVQLRKNHKSVISTSKTEMMTRENYTDDLIYILMF